MGRPRSPNPKNITLGIKVTKNTLHRWNQAFDLYKKIHRETSSEDFLNYLLNSILIDEEEKNRRKREIYKASAECLLEGLKEIIEKL